MPPNRLRVAAICLVASAAPAVAQRTLPASPSADLIVTNARIYTVDDSHPFVSRDGRARRARAVRRLRRARRCSLEGRRHACSTRAARRHSRHGRRARASVRARRLPAQHRPHRHAVVRRGRRARRRRASKTSPAGTWVIGRGWDQNKWGDTRFPTHEALSRISPNNPVVLERVDGHAILVNAAAMRAAGVTAATQGSGRRTHRARRERRADRRVRRQRACRSSIASIPPLSHDEMRTRDARRDRRVEPLGPRRPPRRRASRAKCSTSSRSWRRRASSASASTP